MFQHVGITSPTLDEIAARFRTVAEFDSIFFRPIAPPHLYPDFSRGCEAVLLEVLESDFLRTNVPQLFPLDLEGARDFSLLGPFEFEGSLIQMLLDGTCTEKVVASETEAREITAALLTESVLQPNGHLMAFRMNDRNWSHLTRTATMSSTYFVYVPINKTWWFVGSHDDH